MRSQLAKDVTNKCRYPDGTRENLGSNPPGPCSLFGSLGVEFTGAAGSAL